MNRRRQSTRFAGVEATMEARSRSIRSAALWLVLLILVAPGCDDDDMMSSPPPLGANPAFTGTFKGSITVVQIGGSSTSTITLKLKVNSPLSGDFEIDNGITGEILAGSDASGNSATFTASTDDAGCVGTLAGTIQLVEGTDPELDPDTITISADGLDCNDEVFSINGDALDAQPEICDDKIDNDNDDDTDCADSDCGVCGDGIVNAACGEECDDGNTDVGDGCSSTCMSECMSAITLDPATVTPGTDHVVEVLLTNNKPVRGLQFDIVDDPAQDPGLMEATACSAVILNQSFDCAFNDKTDHVEILIIPSMLNDIIPAGTDVPVAEVTYTITGAGGPLDVQLDIQNALAVDEQDLPCGPF